MNGDFLVGLVVGLVAGATLGMLIMAALVAARAADDLREGWLIDGRGSADVDRDAGVDGDADRPAGDGGAVAAEKERADFYYRLWSEK